MTGLTIALVALAAILFFALRGRKTKRRDAAAEAARRAVEARFERDAAARKDEDSRA